VRKSEDQSIIETAAAIVITVIRTTIAVTITSQRTATKTHNLLSSGNHLPYIAILPQTTATSIFSTNLAIDVQEAN
jgi:hypothetical protein